VTFTFEPPDIEAMCVADKDRHPALRYLAQLGPGSRRTMSEALAKMARLLSDGRCDARSLPWHRLRYEQTSALRDQLSESLAPATTNKHLAALRGVLKQASKLGLIDPDDYERAIDLPAVHGPAPRPNRTLSADQLTALVQACERDSSAAGARDAALFALLFGQGLRRSEVVVLTLADFDRATGSLQVRGSQSREPRRLAVGGDSMPIDTRDPIRSDAAALVLDSLRVKTLIELVSRNATLKRTALDSTSW
jgi:integrase